MRFNEFIPEQELDEGPIGQAVGKGVGAAAKGLGAVAGGVRGAWDAAKQGFQAGRAAVAGTAPAQEPAADAGAAPVSTSAADINAQGPAGTAPAKAQTGAAGSALQKALQATSGASADQAGQTLYAQVKAQVNQLDKKGKQRILQLLQKSLAQPAAPAQAAPAAAPAQEPAPAATAEPAAAPAAEPAQTGQALNPKPGAEQPAPAAPAQEPAPTAAAAPAQEPAPVATAAPAPTGRAQGGGKVAGQLSQTPGAVKKRQARAAAKTAPAVQTAGIIRTGNNLSETLAEKIEQHKRKMFESSLSTGQVSIYKK